MDGRLRHACAGSALGSPMRLKRVYPTTACCMGCVRPPRAGSRMRGARQKQIKAITGPSLPQNQAIAPITQSRIGRTGAPQHGKKWKAPAAV
jgi:hypothetical protein